MAEETPQSNLIDKALSAFRWVASLRFLGQLISWLSTIFVIRFLAPEDFGVITMTEVFTTFLVFFSTMNLGQGLMKVETLTPALIRRTLGILVMVNTGLFLLQFFAAPYVAQFYNNQDLELVLKVLAMTYLLIPWTAIPSSLIARNLDHKKSSTVVLVSSVLSSMLSLFLAYNGFGYWALVAAMVFTVVFNCFWLNVLIKYPRLPSFNFQGTGEVFTFGALIAITDLLYVAYSKADTAIAGKVFDVAEVGLYGVAIQLATMLMSKTVPLFNAIAFPVFARMTSDSGKSNEYLVMIIQFASIIVFPVFFGLAIIGEDLILVLLGDNWVQIAGLFAILSVSVPLRVLAYVISPALQAAGGVRVDMFNALLTLICMCGSILILLPLGLPGVALAWGVSSLCLFLLTVIRGGRVLALPPKQIFTALIPGLVGALAMCFVIYLVVFYFPNINGWLAFYKIPLGAMAYIAFLFLVFREQTRETIRVIMRLTGKA